jgi:hypothetical protein
MSEGIQYFADVSDEQTKLLAEVAKRPKQQQFRDGVLLVSIPLARSNPNRDKDWKPGVLCLASLGLGERSKSRWLAACRIVDGTHQLASDEDCDRYLADAARKRAEIAASSNKTSLVFNQPRPAAEALKG